MNHKCTAVVAVTVEVPVDGIAACWSLSTAYVDARNRALKQAREICSPLGKITKVQVTTVLVEHEEEDAV